MIHFIYLIGFALFVSIVFGAIAHGTREEKIWYGAKIFLQFVGISLAIAWVLYFVPW